MIWLEELIPLLEAQGSAEIFPVLKRPDEKAITEGSYDNPKFVEDVVRDTYLALRALPGVTWFSVQCESHESIHNHIAYAYAESGTD
jgi:GTP cyclohydrolase I